MFKKYTQHAGAAMTAAIVLLAAANAMAVDNTAALKDAIDKAPADKSPTTILITGNFSLTEKITIPANKNITIKSDGATAHTITRDVWNMILNQGLITVAGDGQLTLENITIDGAKTESSGTLVHVSTNAIFTMNTGAILQNNYSLHDGGGVVVRKDGVFNALGGAVKNNMTKGVGHNVYLSQS